jgi:hypothetical protein
VRATCIVAGAQAGARGGGAWPNLPAAHSRFRAPAAPAGYRSGHHVQVGGLGCRARARGRPPGRGGRCSRAASGTFCVPRGGRPAAWRPPQVPDTRLLAPAAAWASGRTTAWRSSPMIKVRPPRRPPARPAANAAASEAGVGVYAVAGSCPARGRAGRGGCRVRAGRPIRRRPQPRVPPPPAPEPLPPCATLQVTAPRPPMWRSRTASASSATQPRTRWGDARSAVRGACRNFCGCTRAHGPGR